MIKPVTDPLQLHECLWSLLEKIELPGNSRTRLTGAAFRFVIDCQRAILLLTHKGLHGPAFALVRPMLEGLQRGYWLNFCAPDDKICSLENFIADLEQRASSQFIEKIDDHIFSQDVVKDIEESRHFEQGLLLSFKEFLLIQKSKRNRDAMHAYTHIGYLMLRGYMSDEAIEASFDRAAISEICRLANHSACWAVIGAAEAAQNRAMAEEVFLISGSLA